MSKAQGQFTIIDYNDALTLTGYIGSNLAKSQMFNPDNNNLQDTEIDEFKPIFISESDFLSAEDLPTPSDMLILENIITFED